MNLIAVKFSDIQLSNLGFVIFLKTYDDDKTLPIFIGVPEAQSIAVQYNKIKTPRPLTHDIFKNILELMHCSIAKIVIDDLIDNTYYAKIFLENKEERYQIDSRPSDAIALALRFDAPIYVDERVLNEGAINVNEAKELEERETSTKGSKESKSKNKIEVLKEALDAAIAEERYEDAATLRDELKKYSDNN